jgi:uncharacterized protein (DUF58 family)
MHENELLNAEAAARVKQLEFFARTRVEGFLKGASRSRLKGISAEFMQHRAYMAGDDLRHLDWRVLARTDKLVTREFEEFTNLDVCLILDHTGSMAFGDDDPMSKADFARHAAALFAYLLNLRNDRYALAACAGEASSFLPHGSGKRHLFSFFHQLVTQRVGGAATLSTSIQTVASRLRRRGVVVVISDCYEDPGALCKALGTLALRGHDVILYQIVHDAELELPYTGFTQFRDLETDELDAADPLEIREAYRDVVAAHHQALRTGSAAFGIEFRRLAVTAQWDQVLTALLHARATA